MDNDELSVLRKVSFFSQFREEELAPLRGLFKTVTLAANETLFRQGDPGDGLYILLSGQIHLVQRWEGRERRIALLGRRGDVLGEMALLASEPRPAQAIAVQPSVLLALKTADFEEVLRRFPALALPLARFLAGRLMQAARRSATVSAGKVLTWVGALHPEEKTVFLSSLALSLLAQTRRRILILDIQGDGTPGFARAWGRPNDRSTDLEPEDFQSGDALRKAVFIHSSGLEVLPLPLDLIEGPLFNGLYPLLDTLRREWDFVLASVPARSNRATRLFWEEADRVLYLREAGAEQGSPLWRELESVVLPQRLDLVELQHGGSPRRNRPGRFYVPWGPELGRSALAAGNPFLRAMDVLPQRGVDRTARALGGLRIGLAMGSGAALGYSIIGMLRVLERHGIFPDLVSGTSMGALIGSFYCAGKSVDEIEEIARGITKARLWTLADFGLPWKGVVVGNAVLRFLRSILRDVTFGDLALPFACVATDINTGEERILRHGPVADAVRASLSLPFFFEPFFLQGRYLVDGGLVNPVPTSVVRAMGADVAIAINITTRPSIKRFPGLRGRKPSAFNPLEGPHIFKVMAKTMYTMQYGISMTGSADADVVLSPNLSDYTWLEFHRAGDIIKIGEEHTERMIPKITAHLPAFSDQCPIPNRPSRPFSY